MKITFLGAAKTVTGSCYLVETKSGRFLVDCGMFQGHSEEDALNEEPFPFDVAGLDFMLLTHAHIDHSGRIPKLYRDGFRGPLYATKATAELCALMLPDSGHIQEMEAEWTNRKRQRAGKPTIKPLYTSQDALDSLKAFKSVRYGELINVSQDISVRFNDAGHTLGSSILEIWVRENGEEIKAVFSGDLGNKGIPILRDPTVIESADYVIMESTYGNRLHEVHESRLERFIGIIDEAIEKGGNIVIPSFAVGRTQEIIYDLNKYVGKYNDKLKKLLSIPVYVDSPMAISATEIFRNNLDCYDEEARAYVEDGDNPLDFPGLKFTRTAEESKALNEIKGSKIIISSSGMCEAGRIKHHLKHNLWRSGSTILFVGYQASRTLGRSLVDGAKKVRLFGEEISVNAKIEMIHGFSGHADRDGLLQWVGSFKAKPKKIFIVHGEEQVMNDFAKLIADEFSIEAIIPSRGEAFVLDSKHSLEAPGYHEGISSRTSELVEMLDKLKEEMNQLAEMLKEDLRLGKTQREVDSIRLKLETLKRGMAELSKQT